MSNKDITFNGKIFRNKKANQWTITIPKAVWDESIVNKTIKVTLEVKE